jgi:hypothetical protein
MNNSSYSVSITSILKRKIARNMDITSGAIHYNIGVKCRFLSYFGLLSTFSGSIGPKFI